MTIRPLNEFDGKGWFKNSVRPVVPDTVVLHATAGSTLAGAVSTLRQKGYGYHFLVEKDGTVWKGAPYLRQVAHAGVSTGPRGPGANRHSIGICWVNLNDGRDPITADQLESAAKLLLELREGIAGLRWLTTHWAITVKRDGSARKTDPRGVDVPRLAAFAGLEAWKPSYAARFSL